MGAGDIGCAMTHGHGGWNAIAGGQVATVGSATLCRNRLCPFFLPAVEKHARQSFFRFEPFGAKGGHATH